VLDADDVTLVVAVDVPDMLADVVAVDDPVVDLLEDTVDVSVVDGDVCSQLWKVPFT
jgi:hypothetical protein